MGQRCQGGHGRVGKCRGQEAGRVQQVTGVLEHCRGSEMLQALENKRSEVSVWAVTLDSDKTLG